MSDLSEIEHNFFDMIEGKTDFSTMIANDGAVLMHRIEQAPAEIQPFLQIAYSGFKAGASAAVGLGQSALGSLVAQNSDTQATMLLNLMQAAGIPTNGVLTVAEHAALVEIINGLKAMLDRMHILYATPPLTTAPVIASGAVAPALEPTPAPEPTAAPAPEPAPVPLA